MNHKLVPIVLMVSLTFLLIGAAVTVAQSMIPQDEIRSPAAGSDASPGRSVAASLVYTYTTAITVTSSSDPDADPSTTCYTTPGVGQTAKSPCTLRRAIVEARAFGAGARPVLIKFNLPLADTGYLASVNAWKISLIAALPALKGGRIIVDGETQSEIGGRTTGPKIILKLYPNSSLSLGEIANEDYNAALNLGIQEGEIALVGGRYNTVENNWVGLTDDGQSIYYIGGDPRVFNYATIRAGTSNNVIRNNKVASSKGKSIYVTGNDNVIVGNYVGTNASGTIPDIAENRKCHADARYYNWFTGDGINLSGSRNQVGGPTAAERNIIAGMLYASADPTGSPPKALEVSGDHHVIQNNYIGVDVNGKELWTCGLGIYIDGEFNQFLDNTIVNARGGALGVYGSSVSLDAITLRRNVIKNSADAIVFGPNVPSAWKNFTPAKVTGITGTLVTGASGDGSPCANCVVEVFLENGDSKVETLKSLAVVTATTSGSWAITLTQALTPAEGLRTSSTTASFGQITSFESGTTSKFSALYPSGVTPPAPTPTGTPVTPPIITPTTPLPTPQPPTTFTTILTVTSSGDPDTSPSTTCYTDPTGVPGPAASPCTLRRAIVEASAMLPISRPVLIKFNIPLADTGYNGALQVWKITLAAALPDVKGGQVVIDGNTQGEIGGRATGPKIILSLTQNTGLKLGQIAGEDNNVARGLAVQKGEIAMVGGDRNIIENCWAGLSDDGQSVDAIGGDPRVSNFASIRAGTSNNVIRNNVAVSTKGINFNIAGNDNVVVGNFSGTRADGTLPAVDIARKCHPDAILNNWFAGDGIHVGGYRNRIGGPTVAERNVFAGMLFASDSPTNTPPDAMVLSGGDHVIQNNYIGKDVNGQEVWVCGDGTYLGGEIIRLVDNAIVNAGGSAIAIYGSDVSLDAITLRGNIIKNTAPAIEFGPSVPAAWKGFAPAQITQINGQTVKGLSGENSPCPYCVVELFLEDADADIEALQSLGVVTATQTGEFTITISAPLTSAQRLRTTSTTLDYGVIENMEAGTTSNLSEIYGPVLTRVDIAGPTTGILSTTYTFTASANVMATTPITYIWQVSNLTTTTTHAAQGLSDTFTFAWETTGRKTITVTATNATGTVTDTHAITLSAGAQNAFTVGPAGGSAVLADSQGTTITLQVPANALSQTYTLVYTSTASVTPPSGWAFAGRAFDLTPSGLTFSLPMTITLNYTDGQVAGLNEMALRLERSIPGGWEDAACGPYDRHPDQNWLAVPVCHLSQFALLGKYFIYLPLVKR